MRDDIARYLRSCPMFLAWMEYTTDVIDDRFGVSGGSAVMSDGTYYWRLDAANYVETYGAALPDDFISHGNRQRWTPPDLSEAQYDVVYAELESMIPASSDGFITFRPTEQEPAVRLDRTGRTFLAPRCKTNPDTAHRPQVVGPRAEDGPRTRAAVVRCWPAGVRCPAPSVYRPDGLIAWRKSSMPPETT